MISSASRDCAVLISTCDNYSDIWEPFFKLFYKLWPDNPYPVFLNSETLDCHNDDVAVTTLMARTANISWTRRLKEALERVDADYIIFMLDDFFLYDYVDTTRLEECITYMREDFDIGSITFYSIDNQTEECTLSGLEKFKNTGKSKVNLTLALWRKSKFLYYLDHDETPWEFEENSFERSLERSDTFYSFSKNARVVMPYDFGKYGLFAGKWFRSTVDLFRKYGIAHDFSARGFYEEYEFGLISYVARQIKMDSYLVPGYSLTRDNPRINTQRVIEEGYFSQIYDVTGAKDAAIWYPSSWYGYAIKDFKCTITFKSGMTKILGAENLFGNFSLCCGIMYCLRPGIFVYIFPYTKQEMTRISIEGYMNKHLDRDSLAAAYDMDVSVVPTERKGLLDGSRIYAEALLIPENFASFRIYSRLCFRYNENYDEKNPILDGKDRFPGHFFQSYKIDKSADHIVRWDIGGSFGGFAIEGLRVEMIYNDCAPRFLESENIKNGDGVLVDGYWVFLSPSAHLLFALPEKRPDEIRISGNVMAPMPRKVLRAVIYGNGQVNKNKNSLLTLNGLRFILSIVKRGVKKYGIIGVVKEVIIRIFQR